MTKKLEEKRLTEKAPYKFADRVPNHSRVLEVRCCTLVIPIPSRRPLRHAVLPLAPRPRGPGAFTRPAPEPDNAPLDQQGPDNAGRLVGQGHGDQHLRLARQHPRQPRARWCAALTGPADHRTRAEDEQTPDGP